MKRWAFYTDFSWVNVWIPLLHTVLRFTIAYLVTILIVVVGMLSNLVLLWRVVFLLSFVPIADPSVMVNKDCQNSGGVSPPWMKNGGVVSPLHPRGPRSLAYVSAVSGGVSEHWFLQCVYTDDVRATLCDRSFSIVPLRLRAGELLKPIRKYLGAFLLCGGTPTSCRTVMDCVSSVCLSVRPSRAES